MIVPSLRDVMQTKYKAVTTQIKCIEGNVPQLLKDYFRLNREIVPRFTRQSNNLHLPTIRTEIAKRSFYYNGSKIFNLLNNK